MNDYDTLVAVGTFLNRIDAEVAQGALKAAQIESMVSADDAGGLQPRHWAGGVKVLARAEEAERASAILKKVE